MQLLLIPFVAIALIEVLLFVLMGEAIGALGVLALVLLGVVAGVWLLKAGSLQALRRVQGALDRGEMPTAEIFDAACMMIAALLLIMPGFLSDMVAVALLLPPLRRMLQRRLRRRYPEPPAGGAAAGPGRPGQGPVIEGDWRRLDDDGDGDDDPSGPTGPGSGRPPGDSPWSGNRS